MDLQPRIRPELRLMGAMPTRAAIWWRPMMPSSGNCARSVRAVTSLILGTDLSSTSASHQTREALIACSMSLSSSASYFSRKPMCRAPGIAPFLILLANAYAAVG